MRASTEGLITSGFRATAFWSAIAKQLVKLLFAILWNCDHIPTQAFLLV